MTHRLFPITKVSRLIYGAVAVLALMIALPACDRNAQPTATDTLRTEKIAIGVNAFMWQASLETLAFIPVASSDPYSGVLVTDWYTPPNNTNERFKITVYIKTRTLRADGAQVAVLRQTRTPAEPQWRTQPSAKDTRLKLENAILTRARELRIAALAEQ